MLEGGIKPAISGEHRVHHPLEVVDRGSETQLQVGGNNLRLSKQAALTTAPGHPQVHV